MYKNYNFKRKVKVISTSVFFLFIIIYAFFRSQDLIFGVKIKNVAFNEKPAQTESKLTESLTKVTGNARNAKILTINGREITIDKNGNFDESIALLPGYNIITIVARDKFGHTDEKDYQLVMETK